MSSGDGIPEILVSWHIRDVPESIKSAVMDQARAEGIKISELLTRLVADARSSGWTFPQAGGAALAVSVERLPKVPATPSRGAKAEKQELESSTLLRLNDTTQKSQGSAKLRLRNAAGLLRDL